MNTITRAELPDLPAVLRLLNDAAAWLHRRGVDQWNHDFTAEHAMPGLARGEVWLVRDRKSVV